MPDIAPIKGLIELTDNYTGQLGLAQAALGNFTQKNQESLKAVAGAAGILGATFAAITVAVVELGKRGSDVNDVNETLIHFAGGAKQAAETMEALRQGTKDTVANFDLAKEAAHLLSAGVKLTTDDFKTLGEAAFVLQNRGLGGTKEQLELVSDALVTGRTRALSMALGVIDAGDAEENFAKKIGVTKDQLSDAGKVEAKRIQVMDILSHAVKDAGAQERDFGEELEHARTIVTNWIDDLGSAVAASDVFKAGFKAIETAVGGAFGGDKQASVKYFTNLIEQGAIKTADFAQVAISMAKVVEGAWNAVKGVVLGLETAVVGIGLGVVASLEAITLAASKLHLIDPNAIEGIRQTRLELQGMTTSLAEQTAEASRSVFGHTQFDTTLDKLSASLTDVRNAMQKASEETAKTTGTTKDADATAKKMGETQAALNAKFIDTVKVQKELEKSTRELAAIMGDYYKEVAQNSQTSAQLQQADIEGTFQKNVASLDKLDPLFKEKYHAYRMIADEELNGISADWDSVKDKSIEGMQEAADKAFNTLRLMESSSLHFTRETLEEQRQKWRDLQDAAKGFGTDTKQAINEVVSTIQILDHAWVTDSDIADATISRTTVMVRTLSGELISLAEAQKRQQAGSSADVTTANFKAAINDYITGHGFNPSGQGVTQYRDPFTLAKGGYSFSEILRYAFDKNYQEKLPPPQGPRIPGFAQGGTVMVGESGPEVVRLPLGSTVYPNGTSPNAGGQSIVIEKGAFQFNYPIMNDPRAKDELGKMISDVVLSRMRGQGKRVG